MSITPLPVFEADADPHHRSALTDKEIYDRLRPPETMVVRFSTMKLVGEYPYAGDVRPGSPACKGGRLQHREREPLRKGGLARSEPRGSCTNDGNIQHRPSP